MRQTSRDTSRLRSADERLAPLVFLSSFVDALLGLDVGVALAERGARHRGHAVHKLGLEEDVGVGEHAVLQGHDHKLNRERKKYKNVHDSFRISVRISVCFFLNKPVSV